jgi:acetyl esterase/lipase
MGCTLATCPDRLAQASPVTHVDDDDAPLYLVNSTDELVPLSQARAMAARLRAAGVDHRLDVLPGTRHALDFREDAWGPTVAFLDKHLTAPTSTRPSRGSWPVVLAAVSASLVIVAAFAAVWWRRRSAAGRNR